MTLLYSSSKLPGREQGHSVGAWKRERAVCDVTKITIYGIGEGRSLVWASPGTVYIMSLNRGWQHSFVSSRQAYTTCITSLKRKPTLPVPWSQRGGYLLAACRLYYSTATPHTFFLIQFSYCYLPRRLARRLLVHVLIVQSYNYVVLGHCLHAISFLFFS